MRFEVLGPLRAKARARGLWCPWVPKEYGGMGLGPLAIVRLALRRAIGPEVRLSRAGPGFMLDLEGHELDLAEFTGQVTGAQRLVTSRDELGGLVALDGARRLGLDVFTIDEATALVARIVGEPRTGAEPGATAELARR